MVDVWMRQARHNTLMNQHLYKICEGIPDAERKMDAGVLFCSIHGGLNYLYLSDRIWMGRLESRPLDYDDLIEDLYTDFNVLRVERESLDRHIEAWIQTLTPRRLLDPVRIPCAGDSPDEPLRLEEALMAFFAEQGARRSQMARRISGFEGLSPRSVLMGASGLPFHPGDPGLVC